MVEKVLLAALDGRPAAEMTGVEKILAAAAPYYRRKAAEMDGVAKILAAAEPGRLRQAAAPGLTEKLRRAAGEPDPELTHTMAKAATIGPRLRAVQQLVQGSRQRLAEVEVRIAATRAHDAEAAAGLRKSIELASRRQHPHHPHDAPLAYFAFRDAMAAAIRGGRVACTPASLVDWAGKSASLASDVAAEWVEAFLGDVEHHHGERARRGH